ncbi:hemerythrin domain-containing protein [Microbispora sp. NPDC046933]|uniref:hemerythrin domain-containing protein n=1 Tax=Microbispora sp. NPDC046933 TaxID=3155618 RepID=UPI0033E8A422
MTTATEQDVIDLLLAQHNQITTMFAEVAAARGDRRRELVNDLVRLLAVHESAEEQVVHPAARSKAGDEVVEARLHEEDRAGVSATDHRSRHVRARPGGPRTPSCDCPGPGGLASAYRLVH